MKKAFRMIWDFISCPFISVAVFLDEERRINEDGRYDKYWERKNRRAMRKGGRD